MKDINKREDVNLVKKIIKKYFRKENNIHFYYNYKSLFYFIIKLIFNIRG